MSSENLKKQHIRTQGKYSDPDLMRGRDKKNKVSPRERNEKKGPKRYSNERRKSDEHSSVKYEEHSTYTFSDLEESKMPVEISSPGKHFLSCTDRGESLIYYKPDFFEEGEAWDLFEFFETTTPWNSKNIVIRGEEYPQPRLVAWYGPYPYSYSGTTLEAAEMPSTVFTVKEKIEDYLRDQGVEAEFNSVLMNMYRNEKDSVAWHSDDELTMGICPTIASISLGEVRRFEIRPKKRFDEEDQLESPEMFMNLCHGSLVVMDGCMQEDWQHRIPKEYHDKGVRINLTFRTVFPIDKRSSEREGLGAASNSTKTARNSGRRIEFNDTNFPALNRNGKTNGRLSDPSELRDRDSAYNNNNNERRGRNSGSKYDDRCNERNSQRQNGDRGYDGRNSGSKFDDRCNERNSQRQNGDRGYDVSPRFSKRELDRETAYKHRADNEAPSKEPFDNERYARELVKKDHRQLDRNNERSDSSNLNAAANAFVPKFSKASVPDYNRMSLEKLLQCDIGTMSKVKLESFTKTLENKVLAIYDEFEPDEKEELKFLLAITDGSQSIKNQKLISIKIANIAVDYVDRKNAPKRS